MNSADYEGAQLIEPPPASVESEQSVLGALLIDNEALARVPALKAEHFYAYQNRTVFQAIVEQVAAGSAADEVTTAEQLQSAGMLSECGGHAFLTALRSCVPSASNIERYAEIVIEKAARRTLLIAADAIAHGARKAVTPSEALAQAQELLDTLSETTRPKTEAAKPRTLDFARLARSNPPPRHWFRDGWVGPEPILLAGAGGEGKSGLSQHEATAGALGRSYFTPEAPPYKSMIWNCEDEHDDMWRRQALICEHVGVELAELDGRVVIESRYGCENALMAKVQGSLCATRLLEQLRQQVNDEAIDVLWLDNVAHFLHADHDDRTEVTAFINALKGLVQGRPFGVAMLAHVSRAQGSEFTGSAAWENAVRMRWYLGRRLPDQKPIDGDDSVDTNGRFLAKRKSNFSAQDYVRFTMREGLLVPDETHQTHVGGLVSVLDDRRAEDVCLAGFRSLAGMGVRTTDGKTTADYLPTQILAKGLASGFTKHDLGRAMNRLMGRGIFSRAVIGKHPNRSDKFGLVLNTEAA